MSNNTISDREFCNMIKAASCDFYKMLNYIVDKDTPFTRKCYSSIIYVAEPVEAFLDEHGARRNKNWVLLTELVASIRNLSIAAFHLKHIINRFQFYRFDILEYENEEFLNEAEKTLKFFNQSIKDLFANVEQESNNLLVAYAADAYTDYDFKDLGANKKLSRDADDEEVSNSEERIIEFSRRFRKASKISREENIDYKMDEEEILKLVPLKINENKMQKLKNIVHGVLSDYDTYVKGTKLEKENENFNTFRSYVSLPFHLMTILIMLCHFYERHEDEIRHGKTVEKISQIVSKSCILDKIVNFAFYYSNIYLQKGNELAESLLTFYVIKESYKLPIPKPLGFHARPATYVSLIVNEHGTEVNLIVEDKKFNAKSVLSLMEAGGMISDLGLKEVTFEGDKRVLDDLKVLAKYNYCEEGNIPRELNYLRILRNVS